MATISRERRKDAVEYARQKLAGILHSVSKLEKEFPLLHQKVGERLNEFDHLPDQVMAPDDADGPRQVYIRSLIADAGSDLVAFEALCLLAARAIDSGDVMPDALKWFALDYLRGNIQPPTPRGAPPVHPARNVLIHGLLFDIVLQFGVAPMRNKGAVSGDSACDIVAEAMPRQARLPKSYSQIEMIWLQGERADREADGDSAEDTPA